MRWTRLAAFGREHGWRYGEVKFSLMIIIINKLSNRGTGRRLSPMPQAVAMSMPVRATRTIAAISSGVTT